MANKRIAIIGHFAENADISDGQTVKTRILFDELSALGRFDIRKVDTYLKRSHPLKLLAKSVWALLTVKDIVVLLSGNGMRFYFPILCFFAKALGTRVYHDAIGGNLDAYVREDPKFRKYLASFRMNWVETEILKNKLAVVGVTNTEVIPNFKRLSPVAESELAVRRGLLRLCTFSRVSAEKGIELAAEAVKELNKEGPFCTLDIYGAPDADYEERFKEVMAAADAGVSYRGCVPYSESVAAISGCDALLFPTYWFGEGFPGTIVDAYSAGLPVIASDHGSNRELVKDGVTGRIIPSKDRDALVNAIRELGAMSPEKLLEMKKNCLREAEKYSPGSYIERIAAALEGGAKNKG
jgi:glycosyltransferase involved in cell wall biosynthesis